MTEEQLGSKLQRSQSFLVLLRIYIKNIVLVAKLTQHNIVHLHNS